MNHTIKESCLNFWEFEKKLSNQNKVLQIRNIIITIQDYIVLDTKFYKKLNTLLNNCIKNFNFQKGLDMVFKILQNVVYQNDPSKVGLIQTHLEEIDKSTMNEWIFDDFKIKCNRSTLLIKKQKNNISHKFLKVIVKMN
jgi:hypothetical protein